MRYPFQSAYVSFLEAYSGVYSEGMIRELWRRYPKIGRQIEELKKRGKMSTTNPVKFTPEDIKEYVRYQRGRGLKPTSISHDVSAIHNLCLFTSENRCVEVARLRYPLLFPRKIEKRLPVMERPVFERVLLYASKLTESSERSRIRAYAEVLFALGAGPRTQELQHAKIRFLDDECSTIFFDYVKGHGTYGQTRTVPIRPEVRSTLRLWLAVRTSKSEYLFPNYDGNYLSTHSLTKDRAVVCKETGLSFDFRKCRRTYAQYLIDEGLPVDKLSVVLGHSTTKTTEKSYARPRDDRVVTEIISEIWSEKNEQN